MAYILFALSFIFLVCATALYVTRNLWKPYAPPIPYLTAPGTIPEPLYKAHTYVTSWVDSFRYSRLPSSFQEDAEAGFQSSNFDLSENIQAGDSRQGLDDNAKREVYKIMSTKKVNFDEARRLYIEQRFGREGIGPDGRPLDRKAFMFS